MKASRYNITKFMGGLLFVSFILFIAGHVLWGKVSSPEMCSSCHMMKPQYFTLKASSHEKVNCVSCHRLTLNMALPVVKILFYAVTGTYSDPIKLIHPIPNKNCLPCHDMKKRTVTASGDVIIPHEIHEEKNVSCSNCHKGVAHGNVSQRRVTYRSDYPKWDLSLAKTMMTDNQTRPEMDLCMRCHKARKGPLACKACHKTSMLPTDHQTREFKEMNHGQAAGVDLKYCNSCHQYMSDQKYEDFTEMTSTSKYLQTYGGTRKSSLDPVLVFQTKQPSETPLDQASRNQEGPKEKIQEPKDSPTAQYLHGNNHQANMEKAAYAKTNDYCQKCHQERPPSHQNETFIEDHGSQAKKDSKKCYVCHDTNPDRLTPEKTACNSCHPSSHYKNWQWKVYHPVKFEGKPRVTKDCYKCHVEGACAKCHR